MTRALVIALSFVLAAGCGGEGEPEAAGTEPVPSSQPSSPVPVSASAHQPMFPGPVGERRAARLAATPMLESARRRELEAQRALGARRERGRALASQMLAAALVASSDPETDDCDHAWAAQQVLHAARELSEGEFLRICRALPEAQRECMSPLYFRAHVDQCVEMQTAAFEQMRTEGRIVPSQ